MKFKFTFAILMLFALSFPYWQESINVTVYSKDGIPMRNAEVMLIYQTYACDKRANITKYTNESGMVSFSFLNTVDESFGKCVERFYTIRANYGGYSNSTVGYVDNKDKNYKLWLPFIAHFISVRDALNRPIGNATITAMNQTYQTDAAGNAYILLPIGTSTEVRVGYGDASASLSINPTASSSTNVTLRVFDLRVSLTDENGNSLAGRIRYGNEEKVLDDSYVIFRSFTDQNPTFYVTVGNVTKAITAKVSSDSLILRYDINPPIISKVETRIDNNRLYIAVTVVDSGKYASGIASYPILSYKGNVSSSEGQRMYFIGNDRYETSIPLKSGEEEIKYTIIATDAQGNSATFSSTYDVTFKIEKEVEKVSRGEFSIFTFIGILVFVVIVYLIYQKIREQSQ